MNQVLLLMDFGLVISKHSDENVVVHYHLVNNADSDLLRIVYAFDNIVASFLSELDFLVRHGTIESEIAGVEAIHKEKEDY